jgi:hypothetical protein
MGGERTFSPGVFYVCSPNCDAHVAVGECPLNVDSGRPLSANSGRSLPASRGFYGTDRGKPFKLRASFGPSEPIASVQLLLRLQSQTKPVS